MSLFSRKILSPEIRNLLQDVRSYFNRITGLDVSLYNLSHPFARIVRILGHHSIDIVLDVGANNGSYARHLRRNGYKRIIHSFEPLSNIYKVLAKMSANDKKWYTHNIALGDSDTEDFINISGNLGSSSMLPMTAVHTDAVRTSAYVGKERITVKKLDSIWSTLCTSHNKVFLKIDTQGMEEKIIRGSMNSLPQIPFIQAELSFVTLYDGEVLFTEFVAMMDKLGYRICAIDQSFLDDISGLGYQCDVLFQRVASNI